MVVTCSYDERTVYRSSIYDLGLSITKANASYIFWVSVLCILTGTTENDDKRTQDIPERRASEGKCECECRSLSQNQEMGT